MGSVDEDLVAKLDLLHMIKTALFGYVVVVGLLLRISHIVTMPLVLILGSPYFIWHLLSS